MYRYIQYQIDFGNSYYMYEKNINTKYKIFVGVSVMYVHCMFHPSTIVELDIKQFMTCFELYWSNTW